MKIKDYNAPGIPQDNSVRIHSFQEKSTPVFIQPIYSKLLHFVVTSSVDESFIVDWQLGGK